MKKNFKLLLLTLIMGGGLFASEAMALEQDSNGVYQIGTAQDWIDFCKLHNEGTNQNLNAVLTADITVEGNYMVGINDFGKPYSGTFDGQGHTITINYNLNEERVAPFRRLNGGTVKNLIVMGTITTTSKLASGVVGGIWSSGSIENCVSYVTINDNSGLDNNGNPTDATHGGICGSFENTNASITVTNCAFLGTINAPNRIGCGGIVGYTNFGTISNSYVGGVLNLATGQNNNIICRDNNDSNKKPTVTNCYYTALQNMNGHSGASQIDLSKLKSALGNDNWSEIYSGAAPLPNQFVPTKNSDNYYELSTASHMRQFAELVNNSNNSANGKMMNDINLSNIWTPIGNNDHRYAGTFDGQFHMINNLTVDLNQENVGIFGIVQSCTIKNLISGPNNSFKGTKGVGGIIGKGDGGGDNGIKLTYVGNESAVYATSQDAGGLIGYISHLSQDVTITNCYNTGNVKAGDNENNHEAAAIAGWLGQKTVSIKGFWNTGSITGSEYGNALWRNGDGSVTKERIYNLHNTDNEATMFTQDQLSNGELCYLLNGSSSENPVWYQTLGSDKYPVPFNSGHKVIYNHTDFYSNIKKISGGFFEITNADDLESFAYTVNSGNTTAKGKLTADIDMNGYNDFPGIGGSKTNDSDPNPICFEGVLDGDFHKIMNLTITKEGLEAVGLVNSATAGASIMNLTIASTCSFSGRKAVGAFVGAIYNNSGIVKFLNCGNEGTVISNGVNAGGILGCNFNGDIAIHMTNCYNNGTVKGGESAGISGWLGNSPVLRNCYNMGEVQGTDYFARMNNNDISLTNCYDSQSTWDALSSTKDGINVFDVATVFTTCFDDAQGGSVWRMYFDADDATKSHPVLYDAAIVYKEDFPNRPVAQENVGVTLYRTVKKGGWNTVCMPFAMNSTLITDYFGGGTLVAELDADKGDSDNILHFKTVTSIEAGKAYLVYPDISEDFSQKTLNNISITAATPNAGTKKAGYTFKGVYEPTSLNADVDRIVANGNTIVKTSGGNLKGFRAYFEGESTSNSRPMYFVVEDETTGIISIGNMSDLQSDGYYDLLGRKMVKPANKGLYIQNGNKVIK